MPHLRVWGHAPRRLSTPPLLRSRRGAPAGCELYASGNNDSQLRAVARAVLDIQIRLVNGEIVVTYLVDNAPVTQQTSPPVPNGRGRNPNPTPPQPSPSDRLPELFGAMVFVRRLGGSFFGHDHRSHPVTRGDELIVLTRMKAVGRNVPPTAKSIPPVTLQNHSWYAWQIDVPTADDAETERWLASVGIDIQDRAWRPSLVTPPEVYGTDRPAFYAPTPVAIRNGSKRSTTRVWDTARRAEQKAALRPGTMQIARSRASVTRVEVKSDSGPRLEYDVVERHLPKEAGIWTVGGGDNSIPVHGTVYLDRAAEKAVVTAEGSDSTFSVTAREPIEPTSPAVRTLLDASADAATTWIGTWSGAYDRFTVESTDTRRFTVCFDDGNTADQGPELAAPTDHSPNDDGSAPPSLRNAPTRRWKAAYTEATSSRPTTNHWEIRSRRGTAARRSHC